VRPSSSGAIRSRVTSISGSSGTSAVASVKEGGAIHLTDPFALGLPHRESSSRWRARRRADATRGGSGATPFRCFLSVAAPCRADLPAGCGEGAPPMMTGLRLALVARLRIGGGGSVRFSTAAREAFDPMNDSKTQKPYPDVPQQPDFPDRKSSGGSSTAGAGTEPSSDRSRGDPRARQGRTSSSSTTVRPSPTACPISGTC
jgi:hypothetical protein